MSEAVITPKRQHKLHYRGRGGQVFIYLGKLLRGFVFQNDWKVLPMTALIAGIVSMVVRRDYFLTMEGTLKGAFALTCVAIWNGCFNSIQVVCRERDIIKREHRSGLHISAYIFSHMVYQALLCLLQSGLTLFVCINTGVKFPQPGLFTPWLIVDIGITIFLISYASDMLSLWVSCITHSTTSAMTVMPFILIFQLVFSGGIFTLPQWAVKMSAASISNYGLKCIAAQSNYNELPLVTGWNSIVKVENQEINTTVTLGQVMDFLQRDDLTPIHDIREREYNTPTTEQLLKTFNVDPNVPFGIEGITLKQLTSIAEITVTADPDTSDSTETVQTVGLPEKFKVGQVIDMLAQMIEEQGLRDESYNISTTVGQILDVIGRERAEIYVETMTANANRNTLYDNTMGNIVRYWLHISFFIFLFAILSVIFLEFVDKDKR